ncbi:hypothetical protein ACTMU2_20355 [Cupriavidus basilensis]
MLNWVAPLSGLARADGGAGRQPLDLTERHDMLAQLAEGKARAEAASRAESAFLASRSVMKSGHR